MLSYARRFPHFRHGRWQGPLVLPWVSQRGVDGELRDGAVVLVRALDQSKEHDYGVFAEALFSAASEAPIAFIDHGLSQGGAELLLEASGWCFSGNLVWRMEFVERRHGGQLR